MKIQFHPEYYLIPQRIAVSLALPAACIAGGIAALSGGVLLSCILALAVGAGFVLFFCFSPSRYDGSASTAIFPVPDESIPTPISSDRLDALTGLANENGLMAWFSEKAARIAADGKGIIVVSADLADFDAVEKTYGKEISEAVLIEVARRVATCTGSEGIAARTNGDEFAAVATVVPRQFAEFAAEQAGKLAELIQRPVELPSGVVWIGGSVGAASGSVNDGASVLAHARDALQRAKRLGRGHYVVYKEQPE